MVLEKIKNLHVEVRRFTEYYSETDELRKKINGIKEGDCIEGYTIKKHLGDGKISKVFLVKKSNQQRALKIFCPQRHLIFINWGLTGNPHPYSNLDAVDAAFWRRRLVKRILPILNSDVDIADGIEQSTQYPGFYSEFISLPESFEQSDMPKLNAKLNMLSARFIDAGLPTFTFGPHHFKYGLRRIRENIRHDKEKNKLILLECEAGLPTFVPTGGIDTDYVDFGKLYNFLKENRTILLNHLGRKEFMNLEEALTLCETSTKRWHASENRTLMQMMNEPYIHKTIEDIASEGKIPKDIVKDLQDNLINPYTKQILGHLAVHWGMGLAVSPIPLPIGLWFRGGYTIFKRLSAETPEEKQIHNWKVLATSCIPVPGLNWFGYLIPLKQENADACQVMAEHYSRTRKKKPLQTLLEESSKPSRWLKTKTFIPKSRRHLYNGRTK